MNAKRQCAMVKSVATSMRAKERKTANKEKITDKMYSILRSIDKALDEVTKDDLTKSEYKAIIDYLKEVRGISPINLSTFYPNLK